MNGLDPEVAERFRSMTQSTRLKVIRHDPAFTCFNDAPWGGSLQWRVLGCLTDVASERTQITRARRKTTHPIIFDPIGLHGHICGVAKSIVERLDSHECDLASSTSGRGLIATLLALSLYGLGSPRVTDILPGQACQKNGRVATRMSDILLEISDGRIRFFYISKTSCSSARWRILGFPTRFAERIIAVLEQNFTKLAMYTLQHPPWLAKTLQRESVITFSRFGDLRGNHIKPYSFKHLFICIMPYLFNMPSVLSEYTDILAIQMGHSQFKNESIQNYSMFEVCDVRPFREIEVQVCAGGLYIAPIPSYKTKEGLSLKTNHSLKKKHAPNAAPARSSKSTKK